ncbi:hypothetical protein K8I61_13635 [bacterium]|nr:hypothetical protein [bacterium]
MRAKIFPVLLIALTLAVAAGCACGDSESDDNDGANDDIGDDDADDDIADDADDDTGGDDDIGDDDTDVDDDNDDDNDDDAADDDAADDDDEPTYLLLVGEDDAGFATWLQTDSGWARQDFPAPGKPALYHRFGPTFVRDGAAGIAFWNAYGDAVTNGYDALDWSAAGGWGPAPFRFDAGGSAVVDGANVTDAGRWWLITRELIFLQTTWSLYRYAGALPVRELGHLTDPVFTAMAFPDDANGYVAGYEPGAGFLFRWEANAFARLDSSESLDDGSISSFTWTQTKAGAQGVGVFSHFSGAREIIELNDAATGSLIAVEFVETPAGCEGNVPTHIASGGDVAIAVDRSGPDNRFRERRGGVWTCRDIGGEQYGSRVAHAVVGKSGEAFVAAWTEPARDPLIFDVTGDDLTPIAPPDDMMHIHGLHAIGPNAPAESFLGAPIQ